MGKVFTKIVVCELIALSAYASQEVTWKTPEQIQQDIDYAMQARAFWDQKLTDFSVKLAMKRQALQSTELVHEKYACCVDIATGSKCDEITGGEGDGPGTITNIVYAGSPTADRVSSIPIAKVQRVPVGRKAAFVKGKQDKGEANYAHGFTIDFNKFNNNGANGYQLCVFPDGWSVNLVKDTPFAISPYQPGVSKGLN